ncbi:hypothetical protein llap_21587 [Limosa lapponica baueri]|uniref:Regulatory protein SIR2 homolog 7 n=1 Tax=Limosa lapponica baueri TaxID=1758121 RepID=A0A2I0T2S9_LIMLA|nr:hypothetical protein llap_21587 [Limosa lapponica baueri]
MVPSTPSSLLSSKSAFLLEKLLDFRRVCTSCTPNREYVRVFDVTERTALHRHHTGRMCHKCGAQLRDTIVHFGEKGTLRQPLNWEAATEAASKADVILCLGSSLKVLKKYPRLWCMSKPPTRRPKLYIVNLQFPYLYPLCHITRCFYLSNTLRAAALPGCVYAEDNKF